MGIQRYRSLIESASPDVTVRTCEAIVEGWDSFVLDVNGDLIFRFPRRQYGVMEQEREIRFLPEVTTALSAEVSRFDFVSRDPPVSRHCSSVTRRFRASP